VSLAFTSSSQHPESSRLPRIMQRRARNRVVIVTTASLSIGKDDNITRYYIRKDDPLRSTPRTKTTPSPRPAFSGACPRTAMHGGATQGGPRTSYLGGYGYLAFGSTRRRDAETRRTRCAKRAAKSLSQTDLASGCVYPQAHSVLTGCRVPRSLQIAPVERTADSGGIQPDALRGPVDATLRVSPQLAYIRCHI